MKSHITWKSDLTFEAKSRQHTIVLDTASLGGKDLGPSPKEVLLSSIAACSGIDVVALLKKHKIEIQAFEMIVQAETTEQHPRIFKEIDLIFDLKLNLKNPETEVAQAVESARLSMTKYCGVSAMVNSTSPIYYTVVINGEIECRDQAKFD